MRSTAAGRLDRRLAEGEFTDQIHSDVEEVLSELAALRKSVQETIQEQEDRTKYGLTPITIHDDLTLPEGFQLTRHSGVRFQTGPDIHEYLALYMPTTRDEGWVQVSTSPFHNPTVQLRGGLLMLRAEKA